MTNQLDELLRKTDGRAKIVGFYIDKGGVGKSTKSYNFAGYCANILNKRVLVIDGDRSKNITTTYGINSSKKKTISDVFKTGEFTICKTKNENIDVLAGDETFTDEGVDITNAPTKYMEFLGWVSDNQKKLDEEYDFIVIDMHNDSSRVTRNLIAACNLIVAVVTPDGDSYKALEELPKMIEDELKPNTIPFRAKESVVDLDIAILPNRITFHGNNLPKLTEEFLKDIEVMDGFIGSMPEKKELRESRVKGQDVFEIYESETESKKKDLSRFINHVKKVFEKIVIKACQKVLESQ